MAGFKKFLMRGNLIDLAVAFILGASFNEVVKAFTQIIMDVIGKVIGGNPDFSSVTILGVNIGVFITAIVSFVILSAVLYFGVVKPFEALQNHGRREVPAEEPAPTSEDLLSEIRDLLKAQQQG